MLLSILQGGEGEGAQSSGLDAEENMGISSPLYQIIDVVFDLRARGFLRRQVGIESPWPVEAVCACVTHPIGRFTWMRMCRLSCTLLLR